MLNLTSVQLAQLNRTEVMHICQDAGYAVTLGEAIRGSRDYWITVYKRIQLQQLYDDETAEERQIIKQVSEWDLTIQII